MNSVSILCLAAWYPLSPKICCNMFLCPQLSAKKLKPSHEQVKPPADRQCDLVREICIHKTVYSCSPDDES